MSLTELKASFPKYLFSSCEEQVDNPMKKISQLFITFIENKLNNNLNFLSKTQSLLFSLNQSISFSDNILNKTKEKNKSIFASIKMLKDKYHNEYLLMINSFENLENKIVKNYIKNQYKSDEENDGYMSDDDNIIKNCASISKKLENSFLNFKKDEIKQYIYEYNNNIMEIINNKNLYNKEFKNLILNILNNFSEYFNNSINGINEEISNIEEDFSNIHLNEYDNNYIIKEKEINSIIYKIFNSKKYNLRILTNNEIINERANTYKINYNKKKILKRFLSDKDKYNIIKEIYNYDFKSINKEEYNLEIEKEKIKINDLLHKLLSYNIKKDIKESITEEEVKILYNLVKITNNNNQNIIYFLSQLYQLRAEGKFEMPIRIFEIINNILYNCLEEIEKNENKYNYKIISTIIMIACTFYKIKDNKKYYLKEKIKNHKLFKSIEFWEDYTAVFIDEDLKKIENDKDIIDEIKKKKKINDILLSKILPSAVTMTKFGIDKNTIFITVDLLMKKYEMDEKNKELLLSLINQQE